MCNHGHCESLCAMKDRMSENHFHSNPLQLMILPVCTLFIMNAEPWLRVRNDGSTGSNGEDGIGYRFA